MKKGLILGVCAVTLWAGAAERVISVAEYRDKMKAAWIGQMYGVAWGFPTEFKFNDVIIPEDKVPKWTPEFYKKWTYGNDDLYVEMTFLRTLEQYGLDVSPRQAGIDFGNSQYMLWCANEAGRNNLRRGIAPPDCSHPKFHNCPNDIDYQIEADYSGIIAPGCPQEVIRLGELFGRLVNYGDGMWAGQFVGACYAEAYFTKDINQILDAGLAAIPPQSDYAQMVRNVRGWHKEFPNDWIKCWEKIRATYSADYNKKIGNKSFVLRGAGGSYAGAKIDARLNGACIVLGLLYSDGDPEKGMLISMRAGYDSDCNPSNVGGIMMTMFGFKSLPAKYQEGLDDTIKFSYTQYDTPALLDVCEKLARQIVVKNGGRIEKGADGVEKFVIPVKKPVPSAYTPTWDPAPPEAPKGVRYTAQEVTARVQKALDEIFPGWKTTPNGIEGLAGRIDCLRVVDLKAPTEIHAYEPFVRTMPTKKGETVTLSRTVKVPAENPTLLLDVSCTPPGTADLTVRIDGEDVFALPLATFRPRWGTGWGAADMAHFKDIEIPLQSWANREVKIELINKSTSDNFGGILWRKISVK